MMVTVEVPRFSGRYLAFWPHVLVAQEKGLKTFLVSHGQGERLHTCLLGNGDRCSHHSMQLCPDQLWSRLIIFSYVHEARKLPH